jgi:hypothetical protein
MTKKQSKKNKKIAEYSSEAGNLSVIKKGENLFEKKQGEEGLKLDKNGLKIGKSSNLIVGKININSAFKKRNKKHYEDSKFHLITDSIMGLIIIVLLVFVLWLSFWQPKNNIILSSQTDGLVSSGGVETFILKYETKHRLKEANLTIKLPNNFVLLDVVPKSIFNASNNTFALKNLYSGANGEIKISGYVLGEVGGFQALGYTFNCKTCGANGIINSLLYNIEDSALEMKVIKPDVFYSNLETPVELVLKNNSSKDLNNLIIEINNNWKILNNNNIFNNKIILDNIKTGETKKISFDLLPVSISDNSLDLNLFLEKDGKTYLQKSFSDQVEINDLKLKTNLGDIVKNTNLAEEVNFFLDYSNEENYSVDDLNFKIRVSNNFKLKNLKLKESNSYIEIIDNLIVIKRDVLPNEKKTIFLSAEIENLEQKENQSFKILSETNYSVNDCSFNYQTSSEDIKLISNLKADIKVYYYTPQGDQIGIGPLPPKVGLPTTYWVFLEFNNQGNELKDFSLVGKLSDSVSWANKKSVARGDLNFNVVNNRFVWNINNINFSEKGQAKLAINFQAKKYMANEIVDLLENMSLKAYDSFAEEWINISFPSIDTNLKSDNLSFGQGIVQP